MTGRKKSKWKDKKHLPQTPPHLGNHMGDNLGEHHSSSMHGGEGSRCGGRSSANSCLMTRLTTHQTGEAMPCPHPRQSQKKQLPSDQFSPTGTNIPTDPNSASVSTKAQHKKMGSWAGLHSPRLPCTLKIKNSFY